MIIEKGTCLLVGGCWYVIVETDKSGLHRCICDHANNTHYWRNEDAELIASAKELILAQNWRMGREKVIDATYVRTCPYEVIAEVLTGCHDK